MEKAQSIIKVKRETFNLCWEKANNLMERGLLFAKSLPTPFGLEECFREEIVTNARYLHRGFYCPSKVRDTIISNSRRGRIVKHPSERTNITHKYLFDQDGRLRIAISFLPGENRFKKEYLVYENNAVLGLSFDAFGTLVGLSEEIFENNRLISYFCASCYVSPNGGKTVGITQIFYEEYSYDEANLLGATVCEIVPYIDNPEDDKELDALVSRTEYRFVREDGFVIGFVDVEQFADIQSNPSSILLFRSSIKL